LRGDIKATGRYGLDISVVRRERAAAIKKM